MWFVFLVQIAQADCDADVTTTILRDAIGDAETAFGALNIQEFIARSDDIRGEILPCMAEPVTRSMAAQVHRLEGLRAFGERDMFAIHAFAAARSIEPQYRFPSTLVPHESPVYDDYTAMDIEAGRFQTLATPAVGAFRFDGSTGDQRPLSWPSLFQHIDDGGAVIATYYLRGKDPMPDYEIWVEPEPEPEAPMALVTAASPVPILPPPPVRKTFGDAHPALVVAAGASAVTAIGLFSAAGVTHQTWADPITPDRQTEVLRKRSNALTVASGLAGLTSVGFGAVVAVTW